MSNNNSLDDAEIHRKIIIRLNHLLKSGVRAHTKKIALLSGMKEEIRMYPWVELDTVIELKSEPFSAENEAYHFADAFYDNFLYKPVVLQEQESYYVYTGWMLKSGIYSYGLNWKFRCYTFPNYS